MKKAVQVLGGGGGGMYAGTVKIGASASRRPNGSHDAARRIAVRFRVAVDVGIGVQALRVALHGIGGEEHRRLGVVVARIEVVQARAIVVLPDEALGRVEGACRVARVAVRPKDLVTFHFGSARCVGEGGDQAAQRIGEIELGAVAI